MIGQTVGHYRVTALLGEGGMGVVYEAEDLRLPRKVALKFLAAASPGDHAARERFEREARATSVLSHPSICVLHDVGEHDGRPFLVMERLEGRSLRERLRDGPMPAEEILRVGAEVADALDAAHAAGIVHRDVKPANIFLTDHGEAKVLDFGVARLRAADADAASEAATLEKLTTPGTAVGTIAYMSPEQVLGRPADARSDVFSLGVVLYEMATGARPFAGESMGAVFDAILHKAPTAPVRLNPRTPAALERIVNRCLEKDPARRWATAAELRDALRGVLDDLRHPGSARAALHRLVHRRWVWAVGALVLASVPIGTAAWSRHQAAVRRARETLTEIRRLVESGPEHSLEAYRLALGVEKTLRGDPELHRLVERVSTTPTILSEPSGATVWAKPYLEKDGPWERLGVTPLRDVRLPRVNTRFRVEKPGFASIQRSASATGFDWATGTIVPGTLRFDLAPADTRPEDMVAIAGGPELPEFLVDRTEVTNRQFKAFVRAGGYQDERLWKHPFVRDGRVVARKDAMASFVDRTGRPGPATWEAGDFPEGKADFPVNGVSWYEAAAYAEFAGKSLPTLDHWWAAAGRPRGSSDLIALSNFRAAGPVAAGSTEAITATGCVDMAGNVREWCQNASAQGHCLRGGAWSDPVYMFASVTQAPSFDRSDRNGFRCVRYLDGKDPPPRSREPYAGAAARDLMKERPVSDDVFAAYARLFDYDARPLQARVEARDETNPGWVRERVSFAAAYGGERVTGQLFLPREARAPYQTVLYFPGSEAVVAGSSDRVAERLTFDRHVSHLLKSGRAVLWPVLKGTLERNDGKVDYMSLHDSGSPTQEYLDFQVMVVRDVRRCLDYLASRPDVDSRKLAYEGFSWGGFEAPLVLGVDRRFAAAIIVLGGLDDRADRRKETDPLNYAPRVTLPVLMLNGRYDLVFRFQSSVGPLYERLGTPPGDKVLRVYETDHAVPRTELVRESLAWLDKYLGPVQPAAPVPPGPTAAR